MGSNKVAMPMSSAGIVGASADIKIAGMEIDPKLLIAAVLLLVILVNVAALVAG